MRDGTVCLGYVIGTMHLSDYEINRERLEANELVHTQLLLLRQISRSTQDLLIVRWISEGNLTDSPGTPTPVPEIRDHVRGGCERKLSEGQSFTRVA
ncbi:MAG: hypothetical protein NW202_00025 [Nitrospira sp.]|nr:hypothetical protein [Nitrospira sp.]